MATYYVDATGGDNTKDGLSQANAWKTIAKVVGSAFVAGDTILFKRGETWAGTALNIGWSGAEGNRITFGAYGSGAKPILDGSDAVNCVWCNGRSHLLFQDIEATQGIDSGFAFTNCHDIQVIDCDAHDAGNDNLIFITNCYDCSVTGGQFYNAYPRVAGVNVSGIEITDGSHDITLTNVTCYDNTGTVEPSGLGITVHNHGATVMPYNITITGATCYGNTDYGINIWKQDNTANTPRNIVIQDCTFHSNDEGIRVHKSAVATNYPNGVTITGCHSYGNAARAFYLQSDNLVVRQCVFEGRGDLVSCHTVQWVNNTAYFIGNAPLYPLYINGTRTGGTFWVKNNIIYRSGTGGMLIGVDASVDPSSLDINYNLYHQASDSLNGTRWYWRGVYHNWNGWLAYSGRDANSPRPGDPAFVNAITSDYRLRDISSAIDAGVDVGLSYNGIAPDLGAYEWLDESGIAIKDGTNAISDPYGVGGLFSNVEV